MLIRQMLAEIWDCHFGRQKRRAQAHARPSSGACLERLEDRTLMTATANLVAYRPQTIALDFATFPIAEEHEDSLNANGPGIRINGDDDNRNGKADFLDTTPTTAAENDLVRVDALGSGTTFVVSWTGPLAVWTTATKAAPVSNGASITPGQSLWVEYTSSVHTVGASTKLTLSASEAAPTTVVNPAPVTDSVTFHSLTSLVVALGGRTQNPTQVGDPNYGTFTLATKLYQSGYDVQMFNENQVKSNGRGAAYDEVSSAVLKRNVDNVAIYGYSWGGGATYNLSNALKGTTALAKAGYSLKYTSYIDGIRQGSISSETRKPPATAFHHNFYQRKDTFLKGNVVSASTNVNVINTTWGKNVTHYTIDDNTELHTSIISTLQSKLPVA